MKKKEIPEKYKGQWVLLNKQNKVLFSSANVADVVKKGRKYPYNEVTIEKKLEPGTCFFWYYATF